MTDWNPGVWQRDEIVSRGYCCFHKVPRCDGLFRTELPTTLYEPNRWCRPGHFIQHISLRRDT